MRGLLAVLVAYLLGGVPFGYLLVRLMSGQDIRAAGSGNIGATNVLRTAGRRAGIVTLLLDMLKGAAAVWIAGWLTHNDVLWMSAAALAVLLGHAFPVFLGFRGGKAVASFVGAFLYLTPLPLLATAVVFFAVVAVSRFISLGSIIGACCFPLAVYLILHPAWPVLAASLLASLLVLVRHRSNMERLRAGTENVLSFKGKRR